MHAWNVSYEEAVAIQNKLRRTVSRSPLRRRIVTVAGADVSCDRGGARLFAALVILQFPSLEPLEWVVAEDEAVLILKLSNACVKEE